MLNQQRSTEEAMDTVPVIAAGGQQSSRTRFLQPKQNQVFQSIPPGNLYDMQYQCLSNNTDGRYPGSSNSDMYVGSSAAESRFAGLPGGSDIRYAGPGPMNIDMRPPEAIHDAYSAEGTVQRARFSPTKFDDRFFGLANEAPTSHVIFGSSSVKISMRVYIYIFNYTGLVILDRFIRHIQSD